MKLHEYQAKNLFSRAGLAVPEGRVAKTPEEAREVAEELSVKVVVKAQVHAGGRGQAGGIKVVESPDEAQQAASSMIGTSLVTRQTGPKGVPVNSVLVEEALDVSKELYVGMVIEASMGGIGLMASDAGGMDIEVVAEQTPSKILRAQVDPMLGLQSYQGRKLAYELGVTPGLVRPITDLMVKLYDLFQKYDCTLAEINPLVVTTDGRVLAADAKLGIDDDALFRQPEILKLRDPEQEDDLEAKAQEFGISFVKLDGDVGCLVNGAGLAMATMDVTMEAGAAPANFLDVGGTASEQKVSEAVKIIFSDPKVTRVLINIFGGILSCDVVANGILSAAEQTSGDVPPLVVRMLGTNAEEGRRLMVESPLNTTLVNDLAGAAKAIKEAV